MQVYDNEGPQAPFDAPGFCVGDPVEYYVPPPRPSLLEALYGSPSRFDRPSDVLGGARAIVAAGEEVASASCAADGMGREGASARGPPSWTLELEAEGITCRQTVTPQTTVHDLRVQLSATLGLCIERILLELEGRLLQDYDESGLVRATDLDLYAKRDALKFVPAAPWWG